AQSLEDLKVLQKYSAAWEAKSVQLLTVNVDDPADNNIRNLTSEFTFPILQGSEEVAAIYNILYRQLFDRHRDLSLPTSFLIDRNGDIVKVYQGPLVPEHVEQDLALIPQTDADRLARALPFPSSRYSLEFG